jgi:hypothetical protein
MINDNAFPVQAESAACRRCGVIAQHTIVSGHGPHPYKLICEACGAHVKWASPRSPQERQRLAAQYRDAYLSSQPPTDKQVKYLEHLGHVGQLPQNRLDASRLIDNLVNGGGQ